MSHDGTWRGACASTTRDKSRRWLWRLVGRWTRWPVASARKGQGGVDKALHSSGCSKLGNPELRATLSLRKNPCCLRGVRRRDRRRSPPIHVMFAQEVMSFAIPLVRTQGASEPMPRATHANFRDEPSNVRAHSLPSFRTEFLSTECPTSKMSHGRGWRDSCVSTRRDRPDRWLWRLVRPFWESWGTSLPN